MASPEIGNSRTVVVKSPSTCHDLARSPLCGRPAAADDCLW
jgi:hypothetical protein